MTQLKDADVPAPFAREVLDPSTLREIAERYLANPVFRAARYDKPVVQDNPYRRPVRPDDIGMVDFSEPLVRENYGQLSCLMAHRMLVNIHDAHRLMLPQEPTPQTWVDHEQFYADANRLLGDLLRPWLEDHVFGFVGADAAPLVESEGGAVRERIAQVAADREAAGAKLADQLRSASGREHQVAMLGVQSVTGRRAFRSGVGVRGGRTATRLSGPVERQVGRARRCAHPPRRTQLHGPIEAVAARHGASTTVGKRRCRCRSGSMLSR